mmetsp:Transcript_29169/g.86350  ORF Transcript_29169/g.86350 Transcript_29169/m.86350 type:complete len:337 (-) Transcript_29169:848-1858(-)
MIGLILQFIVLASVFGTCFFSFEKVTLAVLQFVVDFLFSFVGSLCLGLLSGMLAALLLKKVDMRQTGVLELCLYILVMYVPFFLAEIMTLSGIVTILFTGITAKRYAAPNLSPSTENNADVLFRVTAHLAETAIFLELGLSVFGLSSYGNFHWQFILCALLACLVGRAANIYPITVLFNRFLWKETTRRQAGVEVEMGSFGETSRSDGNVTASSSRLEKLVISKRSSSSEGTRTSYSCQDLKIHWNTAHMLWFSGLRGAVAYACAKTFPNSLGNRTPFVITTMVCARDLQRACVPCVDSSYNSTWMFFILLGHCSCYRVLAWWYHGGRLEHFRYRR